MRYMGRGSSKIGKNKAQSETINRIKQVFKKQGNVTDLKFANNPEAKGEMIFTFIRNRKVSEGKTTSRRQWGYIGKNGKTQIAGTFMGTPPQLFKDVFNL